MNDILVKLYFAGLTLGFGLVLLFLTGCSTLEGTDILKEPITNYKADMRVTVDGVTFDGMAVTGMGSPKSIRVLSNAKMDVLFIHTCGRFVQLQKIDKDSWFGGSGKEYTFNYVPQGTELEGCPIFFEAYDLNGITAWGMVQFRATDLPATTICNGTKWTFSGHSVCQTKIGLEQRIAFDSPTTFKAEEACNLKQINDKTYTFRPALGWCYATFTDGKKFHRLTALGFKRPLIRD